MNLFNCTIDVQENKVSDDSLFACVSYDDQSFGQIIFFRRSVQTSIPFLLLVLSEHMSFLDMISLRLCLTLSTRTTYSTKEYEQLKQ